MKPSSTNFIKKSSIIFMLVLTTVLSKGQSAQDVFNASVPITWLGLDFSEVRIIGDHAAYADKDINTLFLSWNELMLNEAKKYDIAGATDRPKVEYSTDLVNEKNKSIEKDKILSNDTKDHNRLNKEAIQDVINGYKFSGDGIGLMFVVESFNKIEVEAAVYVTFIDLSTKKIILTERMTAAPAGFGIRNYWAGAIYKMLKNMKSKEFKAWKTKYA